MDKEEKVALVLGKEVGGVCYRVLEEVGECVVYCLGIGGGREGSNYCKAKMLEFSPLSLLPLFILEQLVQYI